MKSSSSEEFIALVLQGYVSRCVVSVWETEQRDPSASAGEGLNVSERYDGYFRARTWDRPTILSDKLSCLGVNSVKALN
jgi:hypothetical protein